MDAERIVEAIESHFERTPVDLGELPGVRVPPYFEVWAEGAVGVTRGHLAQTLQRPDQAVGYRGWSGVHMLLTRAVPAHRPYTMLVEIGTGHHDTPEVGLATRHYNTIDEAPVEMFADLMVRFGVPARIGGLVDEPFVAQLTVPSFGSEQPNPADFFTVRPGQPCHVALPFRYAPNGDLEIEWAYALDVTAYRKHTKAARSGRMY